MQIFSISVSLTKKYVVHVFHPYHNLFKQLHFVFPKLIKNAHIHTQDGTSTRAIKIPQLFLKKNPPVFVRMPGAPSPLDKQIFSDGKLNVSQKTRFISMLMFLECTVIPIH